MEGVNNFMKSGTLLRQVINKINADIDFDAMPSGHLFNGLYETMLKDLQSAGKSGEFYTPRPVTRFIVEQVNPKLGETVLDPACGTGGFLTSVIDRFTVNTTGEYKTLQRTIKGIEKKPFPYLLCVTNLIAHGIDVPDIRHDNTLRTPTTDYTVKDKVDVIVTNPPFGGAEEKVISQSVPAELRNSETADLFLVHMMALLKDGGRCGLVLPDGFLFGTGAKAAIKKNLLEECNLHTIVRLPKDVFAPYTNINTNLLFFTKGTPTKGVWYYRLEMPNGYKHFSKTRPMLDEHFQPVRDWWKNKVESDVSQFVPVEDIVAADYNLDFCGFPHDTEEILPPEQFIPQYLNEKAVLSARIEEILGRISAAMTQEDVL
ncbi:type I restriction enzyme M protein [Ruminococcaceae bacterium D5]|nr:type I restriction enzyme M protein [Ruminococcaceae bacterium D5]